MKCIYILLFLFVKSFSLKQALLKCRFNSNFECTSILVENLNLYKPCIHNILVKSLVHKSINEHEEKIVEDHNVKDIKGFALLSLMKNNLSKRLFNPQMIINKSKDDLMRIFHRNIQKNDLYEISVLVVLPSYMYMSINSKIKYNLYIPYKIINSDDYSINFSLWKINNFIRIKFGEVKKELLPIKRKIAKKIRKYYIYS